MRTINAWDSKQSGDKYTPNRLPCTIVITVIKTAPIRQRTQPHTRLGNYKLVDTINRPPAHLSPRILNGGGGLGALENVEQLFLWLRSKLFNPWLAALIFRGISIFAFRSNRKILTVAFVRSCNNWRCVLSLKCFFSSDDSFTPISGIFLILCYMSLPSTAMKILNWR